MKITPAISPQYNQRSAKNNTSFGMKFLPEVLESIERNQKYLGLSDLQAFRELNINPDEYLLTEFRQSFSEGKLGFNMIVSKNGGDVFNQFVPIHELGKTIHYLMTAPFKKIADVLEKKNIQELKDFQKIIEKKKEGNSSLYPHQQALTILKKTYIDLLN